MKTSEFIARVEELGFSVKEKKYTYTNEAWLIVREVEHAAIMGVEKNTRFLMDTDYDSFIYLDYDLREELFGLAVEYARTPIEEREMEKASRETLCTGCNHLKVCKYVEDMENIVTGKQIGRAHV